MSFMFLLVVLCIPSNSFAVSPPWQQYLASPEHTGLSSNSLHGAPCGPQWSVKASTLPIKSSSVVTSMLHVSSQTLVDAVAVLTSDGIVSLFVNAVPQWTFDTSYSFGSDTPPTPAFNVAGDALYVASGFQLYAINVSSGSQMWVSSNLSTVVKYSVAVTSNIIVLSGISNLFLFDPNGNGTSFSTFNCNSTITAPHVVDSLNNDIFFVTGGGTPSLNRINSLGQLLLQIPLAYSVTSSLLISPSSRRLYLISTTGLLQGFTLDTFTSICSAPDTIISTYIPGLSISFASLVSDELIAIPMVNGVSFSKRCILPLYGTFSGFTPSTSFASDGNAIVFGTNEGRLVSVNTQSTYFSLNFVANISATGGIGPSISSSPSVGKNGTLYVGTNDGNLFAFGDLICPAGSYVNGINGCALCPAGSYSKSSSSAQTCSLCPPGTFSTVIGATSNSTCLNCPPGQYSNSSGSTFCKDCPPGSFNSQGQGISQCPACAKSCYCPSGSTVDCPSLMVYPMYAVDQGHLGLSPFPGPTGFPIVSKLPFSTGQSSLPVSGLIIGPQGGIIPANSPLSDLIFIGMSDDVFAVSGLNQALINNYDMPTGQQYDSQPVMSPWGTVYILSSTYTLYALPWNTGGGPLWSFPTVTTSYVKVPSNYTRTPLSLNVALGTVVFSAGGSIYSVNAFNGTLAWTFVMPGDPSSDGICTPSPCPIAVLTTPAVSPDGSLVFFGGDDTRAYALYGTTGKVSWTYQARGKLRGSPCLNADGSLVYIASDENNLLVLTAATGIIAWLTPVATTSSVRVTPAIADDGITAFAGALDGTFFAANINSPKSITWSILLDGSINASATVSSNNIVYVGTSSGSLYSINASTGIVLWKASIGEPIVTAPVVDANGAILLPSFTSSSYYSIIGSIPTASPTPSATSSASSSSTGTSSAVATATTSATPSSTASSTSSATATSTGSNTPTPSPASRTPSPTTPTTDNSALKITNNDVIAIATAVPSTVVILGVIFLFFQRSRFSRRPNLRYQGGVGERVGENEPLRRAEQSLSPQRGGNVSVNVH